MILVSVMRTIKTWQFVVLAVSMASGFLVITTRFLMETAIAESETLVAMANKYPLIGVGVSLLLAGAIATWSFQVGMYAVTRRTGIYFYEVLTASYVACVGVGAGELVAVAFEFVRINRLIAFEVQHAVLGFSVGCIGMGLLYWRSSAGMVDRAR